MLPPLKLRVHLDNFSQSQGLLNCFEDELRNAALAARQTYLCTDISGDSKLVRAPEKEYLLLIYRISQNHARKKNGRKRKLHVPYMRKKFFTHFLPETKWVKAGMARSGMLG